MASKPFLDIQHSTLITPSSSVTSFNNWPFLCQIGANPRLIALLPCCMSCVGLEAVEHCGACLWLLHRWR